MILLTRLFPPNQSFLWQMRFTRDERSNILLCPTRREEEGGGGRRREEEGGGGSRSENE